MDDQARAAPTTARCAHKQQSAALVERFLIVQRSCRRFLDTLRRRRNMGEQKGEVEDRTFEIKFLDPGVQAFSFTFG